MITATFEQPMAGFPEETLSFTTNQHMENIMETAISNTADGTASTHVEGVDNHPIYPEPTAVAAKAGNATPRRNRLSKSEEQALYEKFVVLFRSGCSLDSIERILGLSSKTLGNLLKTAVDRREKLDTTGNQLVMHSAELPETLRAKVAATGAELVKFTFEPDGTSGLFYALSVDTLLSELASTPYTA